MKKFALMIVAAGALFAALPASAQTVVIRDGMHSDRGMHRHGRVHNNRAWRSRAEWRHRGHGRHHQHGKRHRSHSPAIVITR
ncbi:MAG: hypothetical protein V4661_10525 [Pseudomonadota bacterium]